MCLCVSTVISPELHDLHKNLVKILYHFFVHVACGRGSVVLRRSDEMPRGRGKFGFFPIDNPLYIIAFGTRAETAELIEMPFWMTSGLGTI